MEYCKLCKYLSVKEHEQTSKKEHHVCQKYKKRVLHMGHHPEIVRLPECDEPSNNACTRPASAVGTDGESDESAGG